MKRNCSNGKRLSSGWYDTVFNETKFTLLLQNFSVYKSSNSSFANQALMLSNC